MVMAVSPQYAGRFVSPAPTGSSIPIVGYQGTSVAEEYIITVLSALSAPGGQSPIVVRAIMQDEVRMTTGSKWESFLGVITGNPIGNLAELTAQAFFNTSLQNAALSRRIWRGTDPLSLTLNLRFEEEYSSTVEVMQACEALQAMCLPGSSSSTGLGLLIPPGPSPFVLDATTAGKASDLIAVYVGRALSFTNVIIKQVDVSYQTRMGTDGFFKAAKVAVTFETYEIVTKNRLRSASPNDGGIYSTVAVSNAQRYNASQTALAGAAGFQTPTPVANGTAETRGNATQVALNGVQSTPQQYATKNGIQTSGVTTVSPIQHAAGK
jgi:hypothetical protein